MAILSAQFEAAGVALPNSAKVTSAGTVANSFGNLAQALSKAIVVPSIGFSNSAQVNLIASYLAFTSQGNFQDYLSSFARFFGEGFRQDANYFHINKAALPGLTPQANNTAEALLTGLLLRVKDYESNSLISRVTVEHWKTTYINNYQSKILLIKLYADVKYSYTFTSIAGTERGFILNADEKPIINDF